MRALTQNTRQVWSEQPGKPFEILVLQILEKGITGRSYGLLVKADVVDFHDQLSLKAARSASLTLRQSVDLRERLVGKDHKPVEIHVRSGDREIARALQMAIDNLERRGRRAADGEAGEERFLLEDVLDIDAEWERDRYGIRVTATIFAPVCRIRNLGPDRDFPQINV